MKEYVHPEKKNKHINAIIILKRANIITSIQQKVLKRKVTKGIKNYFKILKESRRKK